MRMSRRGVVRGYGESYSGWIVSAVSPNSGGKTHNGGLPALVALGESAGNRKPCEDTEICTPS